MKMIRAIIRPQVQRQAADALEAAGFVAVTKMDVFGRGKQRGISVGSLQYDELPKVLFMLVVEDDQVATAVDCLRNSAYTGNIGDGKIFVSPVEAAYTIRTGEAGL
ncbi:MAG: P-II family nitrogen regulator [Clostridia bacterium]|nr:MAG: P-II family nitrogen regulator [Clostridia bacterium]